jgi:hypothetical protein
VTSNSFPTLTPQGDSKNRPYNLLKSLNLNEISQVSLKTVDTSLRARCALARGQIGGDIGDLEKIRGFNFKSDEVLNAKSKS